MPRERANDAFVDASSKKEKQSTSLTKTKSLQQLIEKEIHKIGESENYAVTLQAYEQELNELKLQIQQMKNEKEKLIEKNEEISKSFKEVLLVGVNLANITSDYAEDSKALKSLKIEFKERLEKEFLKSFPKFTSPNFVEKILLEENMKVVSMLHTLVTSVESDLLEDLSHSLVILFESMGKSNQLLQFMIHCEVATKDMNHLFRIDTLCTRVLKIYFNKVSNHRHYLQTVLVPFLQEIGSSTGTFEVDPQRESDGTLRKNNFKKLLKLLDSILNAFFNTLDSCPMEIRSVCHSVCESLKEINPGTNSNIYIGSILFLKFICPAIVTPEIIGVQNITSEGRRGLVLVAKIIQNLANETEFGDKEAFMIDLNPIIHSHQEKFNQFLSEIPALPPLLMASGNSISFPISNKEKVEATAKVIFAIKKKIAPIDLRSDQQALSTLFSKLYNNDL